MSGASPNNLPPSQPDRRGLLSRIYEHGINWPLSIGATAFVAAGLSVALHAPDYKKRSPMDRIHTALTWEPSFVNEVETGRVQSVQHSKSITKERVGGSKGYKKFNLFDGNQAWARDFAKDPHAGQFTNPQALEPLVRELEKQVFQSGNHIYSLTFQGFASAEDEAPDGGFSRPSRLNKELAQKREQVALQDFYKELYKTREGLALADVMSNLRDNSKIHIAPAVEQNLTPQQVKALDARSTRAGFASGREFVDAWNNSPKSVGRRDRQFLNKLLGSARKVVITESYGKPGSEVIKEEDFCTEYFITDVHTVKKKHKDDLPLPIGLPLIFPRLKRKEKNEPKPEPEPTTPVADEPKPSEIETSPAGRGRGLGWLPNMPKISLPEFLPGSIAGREISLGTITTLALAAVIFIGVNEEGNNCKGEHHRPIPWLAAFGYQIFEGTDKSGEWSIGLPFSEGLQLDFINFQNQVDCHGSGVPGNPNPGPSHPACTQIEITRKNGRETGRKVVFSAGPYSSRTITVPTR